MELQGKKIVVTGGVRGLGYSIVEELLKKGALLTVFDLNEVGLNELHEKHKNVNCIKCDISNYENVVEATSQYHAEFKSADILINNAGILYSEPLVKFTMAGVIKHDVEKWKKVIETDLSSVFYMTSCIVEKMVYTRTKGVIVNISSISSAGNLGQSAYSAAKAGVNALTSTWAKELSPMGIRVVGVSPGFIDTASTQEALKASTLETITKEIPMRRLGKACEIAQGVISVLENDYFNGKIFEIDGGLVVN